VCEDRAVVFDELDTGAIGRALAAMLQLPDDEAEFFFERQDVSQASFNGRVGRTERRVEEGFALRLVRGHGSWVASRDGFEPGALDEALRIVARVHPRAPRPLPAWAPPQPPTRDLTEVLDLLATLSAAVGSKVRLRVRAHERWVRTLGPHVSGSEQRERFWSLTAQDAGVAMSLLVPALLVHEAAEQLERGLEARRRFLEATAHAEPGAVRVVLAPDAAAVVLHEAVAHALEADVLALGGRPEAAIGVQLGGAQLDVLDDPTGAPRDLARSVDDEGVPTLRRWLLRNGIVESPLADRRAARSSDRLVAGAGRRASRHERPGPRSSFLEVPAGRTSFHDLLAEVGDGLLIQAVDRGQLDPRTGRFTLDLPGCRRLRAGTIAEPLGTLRLHGRVADLLGGISAIADQPELAGAGWCAKDGQLLPVWARTPAIAVTTGLEVVA
jgi:TldD protein